MSVAGRTFPQTFNPIKGFAQKYFGLNFPPNSSWRSSCNDHSTSVFDRTSLVKTRATSDDFSIDQESIISALVAPCETDVVISFIVGNSNTYLTRLFKSLWTHCPSPPVPALCFHFKFRIPFDSPKKNQYNAIFTWNEGLTLNPTNIGEHAHLRNNLNPKNEKPFALTKD